MVCPWTWPLYSLDSVKEVDLLVDLEDDCLDFLRVRMALNNNVPMSLSFYFSQDPLSSLWVMFEYEYLLGIYFTCGYLDYITSLCDNFVDLMCGQKVFRSLTLMTIALLFISFHTMKNGGLENVGSTFVILSISLYKYYYSDAKSFKAQHLSFRFVMQNA